MLHVLLSEINKLSMTARFGEQTSIAFRSWDLYEFPLLQSTTKHLCAIKTATQLECYPYDDLNLDFDKNRCAILYDLYARSVRVTTDTSISS